MVLKHALPFLTLIAILGLMSAIIVQVLNYNLKKRILDRDEHNEHTAKILEQLSGSQTLKWAFLLFFGGMGLVVNEVLAYSPTQSAMPYGVEAIFLAAGMVAYYLVQRANQR
jgi:formate-dependent nitrite reductase membrane component NrfD